MFRSIFHTDTLFLKTTAKKVGKRLLNTGLNMGMQIAQDVLNGQSVKKVARANLLLIKSRAKAPSESFLSGALSDIPPQGRGRKVLKLFQPVHDRPRHGERQLQSSGRFLIEYGCTAHPLSVPGKNSSSQLFHVPVTDVSIVKSKWVDYEPVQIGPNPIEFVIKSLSDYIDIKKNGI